MDYERWEKLIDRLVDFGIKRRDKTFDWPSIETGICLTLLEEHKFILENAEPFAMMGIFALLSDQGDNRNRHYSDIVSQYRSFFEGYEIFHDEIHPIEKFRPKIPDNRSFLPFAWSEDCCLFFECIDGKLQQPVGLLDYTVEVDEIVADSLADLLEDLCEGKPIKGMEKEALAGPLLGP